MTPLDKIGDRLYLGHAGARRREMLERAGITHVLAFQLPDEYRSLMPLPDDIEEEVVTMADDDHTNVRAFLPYCNAWIDDALADPNAVVLLHCTAGLSRSPVMAIGYLMSKGRSFDEAVAHVSATRPCICPRPALLQQIYA